MIFNEELKIFQYHFPCNPIFPGALMLDFIKNCILKIENVNLTASARFLNPIYPNKEIDFKAEYKNNETLVSVSNNELTYTKFSLRKGDTNQNNFVEERNLLKEDEHREKFKPMSNSSKEITFLDDWFILKKGDTITAVGEFNYKYCYIDFLSEIEQNKNFGIDFLLIEFMSLTVLSSLSSIKMINLEDNYGFAKLDGYWSKYDLKNGDSLKAIVNSRIIGDGILWDGCVMKDGVIIAAINQGVDLPLKQKG